MIVVAYAHCGGFVTEPFAYSLFALAKQPEVVGIIPAGGFNLPDNRNAIAREFLRLGPEVARWLLMVDTDMRIPPDAPKGLLAVAQATMAHVVGAVYPRADGVCTAAILHPGGWLPCAGWRVGEVRMVDGVGMGCTLISRDVLALMLEDCVDGEPWPWFGYDDLEVNGKPAVQSEDYAFCRRAHRSTSTTIAAVMIPGVRHVKPREIEMATEAAEANHA